MLEPGDFLLPKGELSEDWLSSGGLTELLQSIIEQESASGDSNEAVTAIVYSRAYRVIHADFMSQPAQQRDYNKSDTYTVAQLEYWWNRAEYWLCRHRELVRGTERIRRAVGATR